jgi:hypothetical protein
VLDVVELGAITELTLELAGGGELAVTTPAGDLLEIGSATGVLIPPEALTVWPEPTAHAAGEHAIMEA